MEGRCAGRPRLDGISAYLGTSDAFDGAVADFAEAYAEVNDRDHAAYVAAIAAGNVSARAKV